MRLTLVPAVLVAVALPLAACSDDEPTPEASDGSTTTTIAVLDENGDVDTDALTDALTTAILGEGEESDYGWEVTDASVDEVVVTPTKQVEDVTTEIADTVCGAVTTVVYRYLPSATVSVTDGDGTVLVVSGPTGCAPPEE